MPLIARMINCEGCFVNSILAETRDRMKAPVRAVRRLRRLRARLRASLGPHGLIIMYHRVATPRTDPWALAVSPEHLSQQLEVLKSYGDVVPLSRLDAAMGPGRRRIALTFDDICQDNLVNALPILDRCEVPATMFAVSGAIGSGRDYWWDALGRVFLETAELLRYLSLDLPSFPVIDLGEDRWLTADRAELLAGWDALLDPPPCRRAKAYLRLSEFLKDRPPALIEDVIAQLLAWAGLEREGAADSRPVDEQGLRILADAGPVTIGGHTVTHRALDTAPAPEAEAEIIGCRTRLEDLLGREVREFAYPYGRHDPALTPLQVRAAGFSLACTTREDIVGSSPHPFLLPRIAAPDVDGEGLARLLHEVAGK